VVVSPPAPFTDRLRQIVGNHVVVDPGVVASYTTDWTGRFVGTSTAVVRPGSVDEVAGVVATCRELGLALVPQGGNTGLVGGGVPLHGEVVLSLGRLQALDPVDPVAGQITAGAGVLLAALQDAARSAGWAYPVDLGSRDSATVGGTVATNAGGVHVLRYGDTRAQVVGLEAVLGTGTTVSHLSGLTKDNTGYHWPSLLCGSEGTLGVVTAARLRLVPPTPFHTVAVLAFATVPDAVAASVEVRRMLPALVACELFLLSGLQLVCSVAPVHTPFEQEYPVYLLTEVADTRDPTDDLAEAVDGLAGLLNVAVATDAGGRADLWRCREAHTEAINTLGPPHKLDVTLPASALSEFVERVPSSVKAVAPEALTWLFGHVGDGNIHVNVTGVAPDDNRVDEVVFTLVAALGGSISAEHGIGTAKRRWLDLSRSASEIELFRTIKHTLDPDNILNPNVLLP